MGIPSSDTIHVDNAGDRVVGGTWTSTILVGADWTANGNVSGATLRVVGSAGRHLTASGVKFSLIGGAGADTLTAFGFSVVLDGGAGADIMKGGAGRNEYYVDNVGDQVIDAPRGDSTVIPATRRSTTSSTPASTTRWRRARRSSTCTSGERRASI